jgi:hypothetical protein
MARKRKKNPLNIGKPRSYGGFKRGDEVIVFNGIAAGNSDIDLKRGAVIGFSGNPNHSDHALVDFGDIIRNGHSGNSLTMVGGPFSCWYVPVRYLKPFSKQEVFTLEKARFMAEEEQSDHAWFEGDEDY